MEVPLVSLPQFVQRRFLIAALAGLTFFFGVLLADESHQITRERYSGYSAIHGASIDLRDGGNPYAGGRGRYSYVYPPLYAFLCMPLLSISIQNAARSVMLLDASFIALGMILLSRIMLLRLGLKATATSVAIVALSASLLIVAPIRNEMHGLESNALVFLCFVLALYLIDRHPLLAGLCLAVAINIKYLPIALLPYLLLRRRWMAAGATVVGTAGLALLPALATGWGTNIHYLHMAVGGLLHLTGAGAAPGDIANVPMLTESTSLSITSSLARSAHLHGWPTGSAAGITVLIAAIWAGAILAMYRRGGFPAFRWPRAAAQRFGSYNGLFMMEWAGLISTILALSPNTQDRHLLLAAFPVTLAMALAWFARPARSPYVLAAGAVIVALGVLLPIGPMGRAFTVSWRAAGMPGWFLLVGCGMIMWAGLAELSKRGKSEVEQVNEDRPLLAVR